jgi:hypothetical protein
MVEEEDEAEAEEDEDEEILLMSRVEASRNP